MLPLCFPHSPPRSSCPLFSASPFFSSLCIYAHLSKAATPQSTPYSRVLIMPPKIMPPISIDHLPLLQGSPRVSLSPLQEASGAPSLAGPGMPEPGGRPWIGKSWPRSAQNYHVSLMGRLSAVVHKRFQPLLGDKPEVRTWKPGRRLLPPRLGRSQEQHFRPQSVLILQGRHRYWWGCGSHLERPQGLRGVQVGLDTDSDVVLEPF